MRSHSGSHSASAVHSNGNRITITSKTAAQLLGLSIPNNDQNHKQRFPQQSLYSNLPMRSQSLTQSLYNKQYYGTNIKPRPHSTNNELNSLMNFQQLQHSHDYHLPQKSNHPPYIQSRTTSNLTLNRNRFPISFPSFSAPNSNSFPVTPKYIQSQDLRNSLHMRKNIPQSFSATNAHHMQKIIQPPNSTQMQNMSNNNKYRNRIHQQSLPVKVLQPIHSMKHSNSTSNIRVVIRIKPLSEEEKLERCSYAINILSAANPNTVIVQPLKNKPKKQFTFDCVFNTNTSQQMFFDNCGIKKLIDAAFEGYSTTIFAYGQTGSGKTYSICANPQMKISAISNNNKIEQDASLGLIPRSIIYLWQQMQNSKEYIFRAGYLEIYNEKPRDLLNPSFTNLTVRWNIDIGFFVENQSIVRCKSIEDLFAVFTEGESNRHVGSHALNQKSSRSHCLFTVHIESKHQRQQSSVASAGTSQFIQHGKITFVDLAGSEKLRHSKQTNEQGLRETANINRSLFTLGKVISILDKINSNEIPKTSYVPYRDSILTKLLMDSLGGSGMSVMIACVSPVYKYVADTISTLYYASRARNIANKPVVKINRKDQIINELLMEMKKLKQENKELHQLLQMRMQNGMRPMSNSLPNMNAIQAMSVPPSPYLQIDNNNGIRTQSLLNSMRPVQTHMERKQEYNQDYDYSASLKSMKMAKEFAENEAQFAKKETRKLQGKIENLERVFMHQSLIPA